MMSVIVMLLVLVLARVDSIYVGCMLCTVAMYNAVLCCVVLCCAKETGRKSLVFFPVLIMCQDGLHKQTNCRKF